MSYKVNYYTLAVSRDGVVGNIAQSYDEVYTNEAIINIPSLLEKYLKEKRKVGVITKITELGGICI